MQGGWARYPYWQFSRSDIRKALLKETDRYIITDEKNGIAIMVDFIIIGIRRFFSIAFIDINRGAVATCESSGIAKGKDMQLPESPLADHEVSYFDETMTMAAVRRSDKLQLLVTAPYLKLPSGDIGLKAHIVLYPGISESMNVATCQKTDMRHWIACSDQGPMKAEGTLFIGHRRHELAGSSLGAYEWIRSRWSGNTIFRSSWIAGNDERGPWAIIIGDEEGNSLRNMNCIIRQGRVHRIGDVEMKGSDNSYRIIGDGISIEMDASARRHISTGGTIGAYTDDQAFGRCRGTIVMEGQPPLSFSQAIGMLEIEKCPEDRRHR